MQLTKEELQALIQVVNQPRQQDLQTAQFLIQLNNKMSQMIDEMSNEEEKSKTKKQENK